METYPFPGGSRMCRSAIHFYLDIHKALLMGSAAAKSCGVTPRMGTFCWVGDLDPGRPLGGRIRCGTDNAGWGIEGTAQGLGSWRALIKAKG